MSHRLRVAVVTLAALAGACHSAPRQTVDAATIRLGSGAITATADAALLGDRDTTTGVDLSGPVTVDVDFDHDVEVRAVKVFVRGGVSVGGIGAGTITGAGEGEWVRQALATPVQGRHFTVTLSAASGPARVGELELWGAGRGRVPGELARAARLSSSTDARWENALVVRGTVASATLHPSGAQVGDACVRTRFAAFPARAVRRAYLLYEANVQRAVVLSRSLDSEAPVGGFWLAPTSESGTLVDELDPERLTGSDEVQLCAPREAEGTIAVAGLRLLLLLDDGIEQWDRDTRRRLGAATDGDAATSAELPAGRVDLGLDRLVAVDAGEALITEAAQPSGEIGVLDQAGWVELGGVSWSSPTVLGLVGRTMQGLHLTFAGDAGSRGAKVSEVRIAGSAVGRRIASPRIVITYPETRLVDGREVGERFAGRAFVAGWVESPSGPGVVEVGGARVGDGGVFATPIDRPIQATGSWAAVVRARFPDGTELTRTIDFDDDREAEIHPAVAIGSLSDNERFGKENQDKWGEIDAEHGGKVTLGTDVELEAPPGAVSGKVAIGISRKGAEVMPPLDAGMVNVTAPAHAGYRFLPKGQRFAKPVKVKLPYDPALLPEGTAPEEIQTYFYDEATSRWQALPRVEVSRERQRITSETTHFTFMINAVLVLPDHPGPASFNPNSIKDLKAADPSSAIDFIEPPDANNQGTAQVALPIRLPKARGAYQPTLRLGYDSGASDGWAGVGWSLSVSSVTVDTKFGVPIYDGHERYALDGASLVPGADAPGACLDGVPGRLYHARVEREFKQIVRCGTGPTDFHWEVTDRSGALYVYGATSDKRLTRPLTTPPQPGALPVIAEWYLDRVIDLNGNLTVYGYDFDSRDVATLDAGGHADAVAHGEPFTQAYLRTITYTGRAPRTGADALAAVTESGAYRVELRSERSGRVHLLRTDVISSARTGFKVLTRRRLGSIAVTLVDGAGTHGIREYRLEYETGNYGKSRLKRIGVYGAWEGGASPPFFYAHDLGYHDAPDGEHPEDRPFEEPKPLSFVDGGDDEALSRTESWGFGVHGFVGVGPIAPSSISIGVRGGFNRTKSTNVDAFLDVNGDWLPDRLRLKSSGTQVRFNDGEQFSPILPPSDPYEGRRVATLPISTLGHSSDTSWNVALQARAGPWFSASYGKSWFSSETPDFLIDADGDGLVDVLDRGTVLFNQPRNGNPLPDCTRPESQTTFCFEPSKWIRRIASTSAPAPDLTADLSNDPEIAGAVAEMEAQLRPADALVEWLAPYDGTVEISGALRFARPAAQLDPAWDGVRLAVYLVKPRTDLDGNTTFPEPETVHEVRIQQAEVAVPTPVYVPSVRVASGDRLYFVLSTLDGFPVVKPGPSPVEEVEFAPTITYFGGNDLRDPTNAPLYRFDALDDFRLAGAPLSAVTVPVTGTLELGSTLRKLPCSDDVRVCVQKFGEEDDVQDLRCDASSAAFTLLWNDVLDSRDARDVPVNLSASVRSGEKLVFRVETDLAIDPAAVDWSIAGAMTSICVADGGGCEPPPPEDADEYAFVADPYFPLHLAVDTAMDRTKLVSARPRRSPVVPWVATRPGTIHVANAKDFGRSTSGIVVAIRTLHGLVWQDGQAQKGSLADVAPVVDIDVAPGDLVFFEAHADAPFEFAWTESVDDGNGGWQDVPHQLWTPVITFDGLGMLPEYPTVNVTVDGLRRDDDERLGILSPFGGGFHGWRYGVWGGPNDEAIDPTLFEPSAGEGGFSKSGEEALAEEGLDRLDPDGATEDSVDKKRAERVQPLVPRRNGTYFGKSRPGLKPRVPGYVSRDGNVFVTQGTMHAARDGGYLEGGDEAGSGSSIAARFKMGKMSRLSVGDSTSGGLSLLFAGVNVGAGSTRAKADVRDMNGDGIVDVVSSGGDGQINVRLTDARLLTKLAEYGLSSGGDIQSSKDVSVSYNLGISDAIRTFAPDSSVIGGMVAMFPGISGGVGVNFSATTGELADVNGDGLPDAVRRVPGESGFRVRLNLGTSFGTEDFVPSGRWKDGELDTLIGKLGSGIGSASGRRRAGLLSVLRGGTYRAVSDPNMVRRTTAVSINDNLGKGIGERYQAVVNWESSIAATSVALMDVNGDGLPDYVRKGAKDGKLEVMLNTGYGFAAERGWTMPAWPAHVAKPWLRSKAWLPTSKTLLDWVVGSNPTVDSIEANGSYSLRPTIGFVYSWSFPIWVLRLHFSVGGDYTPKKVAGLDLSLQDVNGDGLPDHVLKAEKATDKDNRSVYVRLNALKKGNLLRSVKRPLGGAFELDYVRTTPSVDMAGSRWVLASVVHRDGRGGAVGGPKVEGHDIPTTFAYAEGYHDRAERDFLGFGRVERVQADGTRIVQRFLTSTFAKKGLLEREETWSADGRLFVQAVNAYSTPMTRLAAPADDCVKRTPFFLDAFDYCQSFEVDLTGTKRTHYEGAVVAGQTDAPAGSTVSSTQEFLEYDAYGNVKVFHDAGDDADPADDVWATVTYKAGDDAFANHSVSRPDTVEVRTAAGTGGTLLRRRKATYDARGNVLTFAASYEDGKTVVTDLEWDPTYGTLHVFKNPEVEGRRYTLTYEYDPRTHTYPVSITDTHGYASTATYDLRFGEVATTTDVNGKVTQRVFDPEGRLEKLYGPKSATDPLVTVAYRLFDDACETGVAWARTSNRLPDGNAIDTVVLIDGLKRVIQTKKTAEVWTRAEDGSVTLGWSVSGQQVFDSVGRVGQQGLTFFERGTNPAFAVGAPQQPTVTTYDPLGRPATITAPAEPDHEKPGVARTAVTRMVYGVSAPPGDTIGRLSTVVTDANQHVRVSYRSLAERVTAVEERLADPGKPPATHVTRYRYNPVGELTHVTDAAGKVTSIGYDLLGRRTQLASLDAGTTDFIYDAMGNLVLKQTSNLRDRRGGPAFIRYEYDLERLVGVRYPEGAATMDVKYEYGPPGVRDDNGAGRIVRVVDDAGAETRAYGDLGELVRSTRTLRPLKPLDPPMVFETRFEFDSYGRMLSIRYPDAERVVYEYDRGGLLRYARGDRPAMDRWPAASEVYLSLMRYDEFGQRRLVKLGNGAISKYGYYDETHRLASLETVSAGRKLQDLVYGYDLVGNVTHEVNRLGLPTDDRSGDVTYEFKYDTLDRLRWAQGIAKARPGVTDEFESSYEYTATHDLRTNKQVHKVTTVTDLGTDVAFPPHTNHDFTYTYGGVGPHQATQIGDTFLAYDGNGNTTSECRDHGDPTCSVNRDHYRQYSWTEDDRLASVIDGGGRSVTRFVYDAAGDRVVKYGRGGASITIGQFFNVKGRTAATKHVFAGTTRLASKLLPPSAWATTTPPPSPVVTASTTTTGSPNVGDGSPSTNGCDPSDYQPQKCPILVNGEPEVPYPFQDTKVRPETYYYHPDHLGSTSWVTDQNGKVHEHVEYFPYGEVWRDPASDRDGAGVKGQRFLFSGKELDEETGLYYFGARYYDPGHARWASADGILSVPAAYIDRSNGRTFAYAFARRESQRALALYAYANNNPYRYADPTGNDAWDVIWYGTGLVGGFLEGLAVPVLPMEYGPPAFANGRAGGMRAGGAVEVAAGVVLDIGGLVTGPGELVIAPVGTAVAGKGVVSILLATQVKPSSPGKMQKEVDRGQAPQDVERVDGSHTGKEEPHVHYEDGTSSTKSGKVHDQNKGEPNPPKGTREWLEGHGWNPPPKK
jgi:RHS repeat-associated protein